jgi:hypothetical protein
MLEDIAGEGLEPLLFALGIMCVHRTSSDFDEMLDPDDFHIQGRAVHDARPCLVLRTYPDRDIVTTFTEYWVDLDRDSSVAKYLVYARDQPLTETVIKYQHTAHGWFPSHWRTENRSGPPPLRVNGVFRRRIEELVIDSPEADSDFQVEIAPGMVVAESTPDGVTWTRGTGEKTTLYRVSEDGRWLLLNHGAGKLWNWKILLSIGESAAVLGLVFYLVFRAIK